MWWCCLSLNTPGLCSEVCRYHEMHHCSCNLWSIYALKQHRLYYMAIKGLLGSCGSGRWLGGLKQRLKNNLFDTPTMRKDRTLVSLDLTRTLFMVKCRTSLFHRQVRTYSPTVVRESRTRKSPFRTTSVSETCDRRTQFKIVFELLRTLVLNR